MYKKLLALLIVPLALSGCISIEQQPVPTNTASVTCSQEEKLAEVCIQLYDPVCGDDKATYSNACEACRAGGVTSYTAGECVTESKSIVTEKLRVHNLVEGQLVTSPLTLTGEAKLWYFEASFPVFLYDANGTQLVAEPATAQGEWMTTEFVPFEVTLTFDQPTTSTGELVFMKDNPSGEPEFDEEVRVPVRFQ